jgi:hypothetical protein
MPSKTLFLEKIIRVDETSNIEIMDINRGRMLKVKNGG